jgi:transcriptional regulator with XRE-family HTH domain
MPPKPLESLGAMVREKRGSRKLREVAAEIKIGSATLLRIESGRIPDVMTFGKICKWLEIDPGVFFGIGPKGGGTHGSADVTAKEPLLVSAHLRADRTANPKTIQAVAQMILLAPNAKCENLGE